MLRKQIKQFLRFFFQWVFRIRKPNLERIEIVSLPHVQVIATAIQEVLTKSGYECVVVSGAPKKAKDKVLYVVLCPQAWKKLPRNRLVVQMEQYPNELFFSRTHMMMLRASLDVLDFSKSNIENIGAHHSFYAGVRWIPISAVQSCPVDVPITKDYDLVFFGHVNQRRREILDFLGQRFKILELVDLYGQELRDQIVRAKACINIHYYHSALLETTRVADVIQLGVPIISERSVDQTDYPWLDEVVKYCDLDDLDGVGNLIEIFSEDHLNLAMDLAVLQGRNRMSEVLVESVGALVK